MTPVFLVTSNITDLAGQMAMALKPIPAIKLVVIDNYSTWDEAIEMTNELAKVAAVFRAPEDLGLDAPWITGLVRDVDDIFGVVTPLAYYDDINPDSIALMLSVMQSNRNLSSLRMSWVPVDGAPDPASDTSCDWEGLPWLPTFYRKAANVEGRVTQSSVRCRYFGGDMAYVNDLREYRQRSKPLGPWPERPI
jgi:hypothetical protein